MDDAERRRAGIRAKYDALRERYSDSISMSGTDQGGSSLLDYQEAAELRDAGSDRRKVPMMLDYRPDLDPERKQD